MIKMDPTEFTPRGSLHEPVYFDKYGKMDSLNVSLVDRDRKDGFCAACCGKIKRMFGMS